MAPIPARKRDLSEFESFRYSIASIYNEHLNYIVYVNDVEHLTSPHRDHFSYVDDAVTTDPVGYMGFSSEFEEPWMKFEEARSKGGYWRETRDLEHTLAVLLLKWPSKEREREHEHVRSRYLYAQDELESLFRGSAQRWREETGMLSTIAQRAMHPDYLRIIGLGRQALPLLYKELKQRPDHWFWALRAIAGDDPTLPNSKFNDAVDAWLRWLEEAGYAE
jgi:hypothetical protein